MVLLHGLGRTSFSMYPFAWFLRSRGFRVLNLSYSSRREEIEEHTERIREQLQSSTKAGETLSFLTHSMGGVVLRRLAQKYHTEFSLHRAVMLGPPNQGAQVAGVALKIPLVAWSLGPSLRQLSELHLEEACPGLEVGVIAGGTGFSRGLMPIILDGDNDGLVRVEETRLAGMTDFVRLLLLHPIMMFSPRVMLLTEQFLKTGRFKKD